MLTIKLGESLAAAWGLARYRSLGGEELSSFASLVFLGFSFSLFFYFSFHYNFCTIQEDLN